MMNTIQGESLLNALDGDELELEVLPFTSLESPATADLYEIAVRIRDREIARVGVWKSASGGVDGDGSPHVRSVGPQVQVSAGDGMNGSFDIDCEFECQAEELAAGLNERFAQVYDSIEVEITNAV